MVVGDELLVIASLTQEDSHLLPGVGYRPLGDSLDILGVGSDTFLGYTMSQVFYGVAEEEALFRPQFDPGFNEGRQNGLQVGEVLLEVLGVDQGVVEVGERHFPRDTIQHPPHEAGVAGGCIR